MESKLPKLLISVVVPTYNRNDLLARCLDQLAPGRQTLASDQYEVIVTDDSSQAISQPMIQARYPWARWIAGPRRGPAANRNHGASQANGHWIAFTDDDCVPSVDWLAAFLGAVESGINVYEGRTTSDAGVHRFCEDAPVNEVGGNLPSCNFMIMRSTFEEIGRFDENFRMAAMEDYDLRDRLLAAGHRFPFVRSAVVDHPPRSRLTGRRVGPQWEFRVYYLRKCGNYRRLQYWLPIFIIKTRVAEMRGRYNVREYPAAMKSLLGEVLYVAAHVRRWERKYDAYGRCWSDS